MRVVNDLVGYKNIKILQDTDFFKFSLDSILLSRFVTINKKVSKILDIGTGNAPIPLVLSNFTNASIIGFEIQSDISLLASESVKINNLQKQIAIINDDIKNINKYFSFGYFDLIMTNPPYFKVFNDSKKNKFDQKTIARHEVKLTLEDVIGISGKYLKNAGIFAMVHRSERLREIIEIMQKNNIEPKRLQFIYPNRKANSNMVLIEGKKNANVGLKVLPAIFAHKANGDYTDEIKEKFK